MLASRCSDADVSWKRLLTAMSSIYLLSSVRCHSRLTLAAVSALFTFFTYLAAVWLFCGQHLFSVHSATFNRDEKRCIFCGIWSSRWGDWMQFFSCVDQSSMQLSRSHIVWNHNRAIPAQKTAICYFHESIDAMSFSIIETKMIY